MDGTDPAGSAASADDFSSWDDLLADEIRAPEAPFADRCAQDEQNHAGAGARFGFLGQVVEQQQRRPGRPVGSSGSALMRQRLEEMVANEPPAVQAPSAQKQNVSAALQKREEIEQLQNMFGPLKYLRNVGSSFQRVVATSLVESVQKLARNATTRAHLVIPQQDEGRDHGSSSAELRSAGLTQGSVLNHVVYGRALTCSTSSLAGLDKTSKRPTSKSALQSSMISAGALALECSALLCSSALSSIKDVCARASALSSMKLKPLMFLRRVRYDETPSRVREALLFDLDLDEASYHSGSSEEARNVLDFGAGLGADDEEDDASLDPEHEPDYAAGDTDDDDDNNTDSDLVRAGGQKIAAAAPRVPRDPEFCLLEEWPERPDEGNDLPSAAAGATVVVPELEIEAEAPVPPPPPPVAPREPPREVRPAEQTLDTVGLGKIRYYRHHQYFVAFCSNPAHGDCRVQRTAVGSTADFRAGSKLAGQGRPLGLLSAWLASAYDFGTQREHKQLSKTLRLETREQGRQDLADVQGSDTLFDLERPRRRGEPEEPRVLP